MVKILTNIKKVVKISTISKLKVVEKVKIYQIFYPIFRWLKMWSKILYYLVVIILVFKVSNFLEYLIYSHAKILFLKLFSLLNLLPRSGQWRNNLLTAISWWLSLAKTSLHEKSLDEGVSIGDNHWLKKKIKIFKIKKKSLKRKKKKDTYQSPIRLI